MGSLIAGCPRRLARHRVPEKRGEISVARTHWPSEEESHSERDDDAGPC